MKDLYISSIYESWISTKVVHGIHAGLIILGQSEVRTNDTNPGLKVITLFFMLNSGEHEIYPAHKCQNANNCWHFNINNSRINTTIVGILTIISRINTTIVGI